MKGASLVQRIGILMLFFLCSSALTTWAQKGSQQGLGQGGGTCSTESELNVRKRIAELQWMNMKDVVAAFVTEDIYVVVKEEKDRYLVGTIIIKRGKDISATYGGEFIDVQVQDVLYTNEDVIIVLKRRGFKVDAGGERQFTKPSFYRVVITKEKYISAIKSYLEGKKPGNLIETSATKVDIN